MAQTVIGLFDRFSDAESAVTELENSGVSKNDVSIVANETNGDYASYREKHGLPAAGHGAEWGMGLGGAGGILLGLGLLAIPGLGPLAAAGPLVAGLTGAGVGAAAGAATGGIADSLTDRGVPEEHAGYFTEGIRRGGTLVTVDSDDLSVDRIITILNRNGAVDINERASYYQSTGYTPHNADTKPFTAAELAADRTRLASYVPGAASATVMPASDNYTANTTATNVPPATTNFNETTRTLDANQREVLPVVEEELQVGKREVQRGGVRVYTRVTEKPVEASVNLREEHITVERHAVNRPVTDADMAFKEGTIEVTERAEEAVIAKQARVVEEVVVGKEASERTQIVSDTVRRTDVEVEQIPGQTYTGNTTTTNAEHTSRLGSVEGSTPGIQTGGHAADGTPDTRGITEKIADTLTGNRVDDKTGKPV